MCPSLRTGYITRMHVILSPFDNVCKFVGFVFIHFLATKSLTRFSFMHRSSFIAAHKDYPHVAQLINGCLVSRMSSVRRYAYEALANVALFAKTHRVRLPTKRGRA